MTNSIVWLVLFHTESTPNITGSDTINSYVGGQAGHSTVSHSSIWSDMASCTNAHLHPPHIVTLVTALRTVLAGVTTHWIEPMTVTLLPCDQPVTIL